MGGQELHGVQTQKTEANDHSLFPQGEGCLPDAMQGDAAQHAEGRGLKIHALGDGYAEIIRHPDHFGMGSKTGPHDGHPVTLFKTGDSGPHLPHHAGRTISQGHRLIEAVHGFLKNADKAFFLGFGPGLAHEIRPGSGLPPKDSSSPISIISFSVPTLMSEALFCTSTPPGLQDGSGTSARLIFPFL